MRQIALLLLTSTFLYACSTIEMRERETTFAEATHVYSKAVRWSDFQDAEQMRRLDEKHTARPLPADDIRITSYKTISIQPSADGNEMALTVRITYYHNDTLTLKDVTDQQVWKYNADDKYWYITTPLPEFR
jgi:hypothetical protein